MGESDGERHSSKFQRIDWMIRDGNERNHRSRDSVAYSVRTENVLCFLFAALLDLTCGT
ncbi:hypothetical protein CY34DRAFT_807324 [Suillus luteus UH-Slu-Lm8-n1]|uniref:Uncharacterized protein n=1 Tax=Suillus luteus UH-Slu-Lm8-n1 TaxID=930992 RepID=A0A0C9ZRE6_9AGAM|nr:hypothetical protein CY34DRAFT_807324 [Suillus luteus UH-Slu-Lm8-n1]